MRMTYDKVADAAYIYFSEKMVSQTKEASPSIYIDYDANNKIIGIEILDFSSAVVKRELEQLNKKGLGIPFSLSDNTTVQPTS